MHVFGRQVEQADHDAASKLGIKLGLIINDMHEALDEVELHMEVGKVGGYAASQSLHFHHPKLATLFFKSFLSFF